jgi:signal transduction histidine kinase
LAELVREVAERESTLTSRHQITVTGAEPAVVNGDRDRLEQVFVNLLDNAIRYSPEGGPIDVTVEIGPTDVTVAVSDRGIGIPRDKQEHIFERFYRAHTRTAHDYGGMGIGLFISREIVRRHGGELTFTSVEGQGSTFYVRLPT